jgi:hypothetical protein
LNGLSSEKHVFLLPKNQVTGDDYGNFNKKQVKTEIARLIANLIQAPADLDIDANNIIIVPAKPEKPENQKYS